MADAADRVGGEARRVARPAVRDQGDVAGAGQLGDNLGEPGGLTEQSARIGRAAEGGVGARCERDHPLTGRRFRDRERGGDDAGLGEVEQPAGGRRPWRQVGHGADGDADDDRRQRSGHQRRRVERGELRPVEVVLADRR